MSSNTAVKSYQVTLSPGIVEDVPVFGSAGRSTHITSPPDSIIAVVMEVPIAPSPPVTLRS
jgi:hypothetical protein